MHLIVVNVFKCFPYLFDLTLVQNMHKSSANTMGNGWLVIIFQHNDNIANEILLLYL